MFPSPPSLALSNRDQLIAHAFEAALRGELPTHEDQSIGLLMDEMMEVSQQHMDKTREDAVRNQQQEARLAEFRSYGFGVYSPTSTPEPATKTSPPAEACREEAAEEGESAAVVAKRARNTADARKSRAKKVARLEELKAKVETLQGKGETETEKKGDEKGNSVSSV